MNPSENSSLPWEQNVYNTAKRNDITVRSWQEFESQSSILRQDFFVISTKLDRWAESTGGCNGGPTKTSSDETLIDTNKISEHEVTTQQPGTFAFLYENDIEKVYVYIIKSGGAPDGVRLRYIKTFGGEKGTANKLSIQNISGEEFGENRWLLAGEIVYVHVNK